MQIGVVVRKPEVTRAGAVELLQRAAPPCQGHEDGLRRPDDLGSPAERPIEVGCLQADTTSPAVGPRPRRQPRERTECAAQALRRDDALTTERPSHVLVVDYCLGEGPAGVEVPESEQVRIGEAGHQTRRPSS